VVPEVAVLTNISQDHLDYHGTMARYVAAKQRMFAHNPKLQVLNADDKYYASFAKLAAQERTSYGLNRGQVRALEVKLGSSGSDFRLGDELVHLNLPGQYNVYNALAAAAVGKGLGIPAAQVKAGLEALESVPGRMELIDGGQKFTVVVDYAHTPDALENLWSTLKASTKGRLIVVFGATGDRDRTKRPIMAAIAGKLADVIILTDEEPYTEDPLQIITELETGLKGQKYEVEPDRRAAIAKAFALAKAGDVVTLTGLGHQKYKVVGEQHLPWDDRDVAREELKKLHG
jgi:UDP-N-acetylmuramoyl-L-alanyl-D-glutamate--2,6-diaminopimelate ligase